MLRVLVLATTATAAGNWRRQFSPYDTILDPRDDITEFDCAAHGGLIQVLHPVPEPGGGTSDFYGVTEFNLTRFTHDPIYKIDYAPFTSGGYNGANKMNSFAMYTDSLGAHYPIGAFGQVGVTNADSSVGPQLCVFDNTEHACLTTALVSDGNEVNGQTAFSTNFGAIIGANYYYGHSKQNTIYVVKGLDTASPEVVPRDDLKLRILISLFEGSKLMADIALLPSSAVVDEHGAVNASLNYFIGLSPRTPNGDKYGTFVGKIDASGEVVEYAALANYFDWGDKTVPSGNSGFGGGYTFTPAGKAPRAFFSANSGWGLFEVALPLTVPASCWNGGYQTTSGHAKCTAQGAHRLAWRMESAVSGNNDGMNCPETEIMIPTDPPAPAPTALPLPAPTLFPTTALPIPAPTLFPTTPYEEMNCNGTLHRYDGRAACCADMDSGALDAFLSGLTADSIKDACNAKGYGSP